MNQDYQTLPIDPTSTATLAARGLRFALVDDAAFADWSQAVSRGFLDGRTADAVIESRRANAAFRRASGIYDDTAAEPSVPVATASAWPADLTLPGRASIPAWAISTITVAPTHRRKGLATQLLEAELRTAIAAGIPVAMLTVSESTIYSRFGFSPAALSADWTIDTAWVRWSGPQAAGRVQFVEAATIAEQGAALAERVRLDTPGQMTFEGFLWERLIGLGAGNEDSAKKLRFVRYDDEAGTPQGFAVYEVLDATTPADRAIVEVKYLVAATDDAYAGLWRFLIELDLVGELRAPLRSIDEPLAWQVHDYRAAVKSKERDHLWTRILDVPAALTARSYHAPGHLVFDVTDPQGFTTGRYLHTISSDGTSVVTPLDGDIPDDADAVGITINDLSAILLGGVSAHTLARAGRIEELTPGAASVVDLSYRSAVVPWLSIWF